MIWFLIGFVFSRPFISCFLMLVFSILFLLAIYPLVCILPLFLFILDFYLKPVVNFLILILIRSDYMRFSVFYFLLFSFHSLICLFVATTFSLIFPLYPLFVHFIVWLTPCSFLTALLFAQLFPFSGGPWL